MKPPLVCLATRKRKVRVDDLGDQVSSTATARDVPPTSTGDVSQAIDNVGIALPPLVQCLPQASMAMTIVVSPPPRLKKK